MRIFAAGTRRDCGSKLVERHWHTEHVGRSCVVGRRAELSEIAVFAYKVMIELAAFHHQVRNTVGDSKIAMRLEHQHIVRKIAGARASRGHVDDRDFLAARAPINQA